MKDIFKMLPIAAVFMLFMISALQAADQQFEFTFTKTVPKTVSVSISAVLQSLVDCTPAPTNLDYDEETPDSNVNSVIIRTFKKSESRNIGSEWHSSGAINIVTSGGGKNYDLASGQFKYTVTNIPATEEPLIGLVYKNGSSTPADSLEFSASPASSSGGPRPVPRAGYVNLGDIGSNSGAGTAVTYGGFATDASKTNGSDYSIITVTMSNQDNTNYTIQATLNSNDNTLGIMRTVDPVVIYDKTATGFKILVPENGNVVQDIRIDLLLLKY
jgi:hypothetical protein